MINHNSNTVETYIPVPSNPKRLALSADGTRLYVIFADVELLVAIDTGQLAYDDQAAERSPKARGFRCTTRRR